MERTNASTPARTRRSPRTWPCPPALIPTPTLTLAPALAPALTLALTLALAPAARAQSVPETREYSRRGELSVGAAAPSNAAMIAAIERGSPEQLKATLEYGERVVCAGCVPLLERKLLASDDARVRELSAWWLRRQPFAGPAILAKLKKLVREDPSPVRRARAAEALGEFMDGHALESLAAATREDEEPTVRAAATRALARLNRQDAGSTIAAALADPAHEVRAAALDVLITLRGFRDHAALFPLLADADVGLRAQAARLCGEFRLSAAEGTLSALLAGDPAPSVRKAAAWALGRIGGASGRAALTARRGSETDPLVLSAIDIAERMPPRAP